MGKLQEKLVITIANLTKNCKTNKKQLIMSSVSLFLATAILISVTFCWFAIKNATADTGVMELTAGNGLRVNDGEDNDNIVEIKNSATLMPASCIDGRNLFFPTDGSFSSKTEDMTFRKANVGDKNIYYVQVDFSLTAEADNTDVYIDPENTYITVDESAEAAAPLRAAIWYEGLKSPIVFNPYKNSTIENAVSSVDTSTGYVIDTAKQTSVEFSEYSFSNRKGIIRLNAGETRAMSVIIWLEGTDSACTDAIQGKDLDVKMTFSTSWDYTETIKLIDKTNWLSQALENGGSSLVLNYTYQGVTTKFTMYKSSDSWYCKIPGNAVNDVTFELISSEGEVLNVWEHDINKLSTKNRKDYTVYTAEGTREDCYGHWNDRTEEGYATDNGGGDLGEDW